MDGSDSPVAATLGIVVVAHVDTGPLWYQWIALAGHHAWLWYVAEALDAERLIRETSPDVLLVDAISADDPAWAKVQQVRQRFPHAKLPVLAVGSDARLSGSGVHLVPHLQSVRELVTALKGVTLVNVKQASSNQRAQAPDL